MQYPPFCRVAVVLAVSLINACATSTSLPTAEIEPRTESPGLPSAPSIKPDVVDVAAAARAGETSVFPTSLSICPRMTVSNAPMADNQNVIKGYQPIVTVNGTPLAIAPVEAGCLSSGFGPRGGRLHKGIDLFHAVPVKILAAADGRVREKAYRDDYGNMLVIEHGDGVFARYAHLQSFADGVTIGATVSSGQTIGIMGNTASYRIARHLHYEVLTGTYGTLTGSFSLTPVDLFEYLPGN